MVITRIMISVLETSILSIFITLMVFSTLANDINTFKKSFMFMPDNDLWKDDHYYRQFKSNVSKEMFDKIIQAGRDAYKSEDESLTIKANWDSSTVNATTSRMFGSVTIEMFGGLARRPEIILEGFTLVMCHELGHAYGGEPLIQDNAWFYMSAEGQSDYYATLECYNRIAERVFELSRINPNQTTFFIKNKCKKYSNGKDFSNCLAKLEGGLSLGTLLSKLGSSVPPKYETPDTLVVSETVLSYPQTVQCRVDTYLAGGLELQRPACWFKE
ncbi:MAG: hypothetical protein HQK49_17630 [Oligoflexia bacterium]|nr:hypothetical protein [Oligoflexia bacterium]